MSSQAPTEKTPLMPREDPEKQIQRATSPKRSSSFTENATEVKSSIEWWMFVVLLISGLQSAVGVPYMAFGLFSSNLRDKTGLSEVDTTTILNCGMFGGLVLCLLPGMLFDAYGYRAMVIIGGVFSISGALTFFFYLSQGGSAMMPLAIGYFLLSFGARCHYLAGQVASMNVFPAEVAGSVSATIAICVSCGYILLPVAWKTIFQNADAPTAQPIADFHGFLAAIFMVNTILGLAVSPLVKAPAPAPGKAGATKLQPSLTSKFMKLASSDGLVMIAFIACAMSFLMVYITSGCAAVGKDALGDVSASIRDSKVASVLANVGLVGMAGRFILGFGADFLQLVPGVGKAARWLTLMVAAVMQAVVYVLFATQYLGDGVADAGYWSVASCLIAFAYGGSFALFPATVRTLFPPADMGFYFGLLQSLCGVLNVVYSMIFVKVHWGASAWEIMAVGSVLEFAACAVNAWRYQGL